MSGSEEKKQSSTAAEHKSNAAERSDDVEMESKEEEQPSNEQTQHPLLAIAQDLFLLQSSEVALDAAERKKILADLQARIAANDMTGLQQHLESSRTDKATEGAFKYLSDNGWKSDASALAAMQKRNDEAIKAADAKIQEATEVAGDTEVREAMLARADLYAKWGSRAKALEEYNVVLDKTVGIASKVDVQLAKLRLSLAFLDTTRSQSDANLRNFKTDLDKAQALIEQGGDWERKNQLAVYEAVYLMLTRRFKEAAKLLLDAVATFTTTELFDYSTFVVHASVLSLISVDRSTLNKEVLKSPEILAVLDDTPGLRQLLNSLYKCDYASFFQALNTVMPTLQRSRYLAPHLKFYLRELRVVAYTQFLSSYKSASLEAMAAEFGVSRSFMDAELFRFISGGRIHAKMDAVGGRVDTNRPDQRNMIYNQLVKNGDLLLNRLHKLSKVISL